MRDLRRARARARRDGDRGEILPRQRAPPRARSASSPATASASASARSCASTRHHPPSGRVLPGHHGGAPRPHAPVHDPDGGEPLPRRAGHGSVGQGGARARPVHLLRLASSSACPGQAKNAILAVLGADLYMKRVVVVDQDVDVFDDRQVNWAIATRCQPDRDITIITHARGSDLDPSARDDGLQRRSGAWTRRPSPRWPPTRPRHRVPPDVWQRIDLKTSSPSARSPAWRRTSSQRLGGGARAPAGQARPRLGRRRAGLRPSWRRRSAGTARDLAARGVTAGDRIALILRNRWPFVVALLGRARGSARPSLRSPAAHAGERARRPGRPAAGARRRGPPWGTP